MVSSLGRLCRARVSVGLLALAALLVPVVDRARAGGLPPAEALKRFRVPPGFEMRLFAAEPEIKQPVSMSFDRRGRMWVIQYLQYPTPAGLNAVKVDNFLRTVYDRVPEPPPKGPRGADRITILEDTDGDGHADKSKDFLAGLNLTTGLVLGHGGVFVMQAPYLLFYADRNGDDVPDGDPEVLLSGFGIEDSHALANSLQWGPDGWLYGAQGSTVTAHIRGLTFQQGIWRYHPLTKRFELFAEGGGNTWGADFDRHGNMIAGTNFGGRASLHQVQGAYYVKNFGKHGELQNPFAFGYFEHIPYKDFQGGHVTCGGIVYQADAFPAQFRDQYIAANVLSHAIHWHKIEPQGSSFTNRLGGELVTTDDVWFRPVDCTQGPDGSLFIADWYDQRANHVDPKDDWDKGTGRIYKLEYRGTKQVSGLDLERLTSEELVDRLADRNDWVVRQARAILAQRRDMAIVSRLRRQVFESKDEALALESLWAWYVTAGLAMDDVPRLLEHPSEDVRTWTVRLLGDEGSVPTSVASRLAELASSDSSPTVRSQLACTAKRLPAAEALPIVRGLLTRSEDLGDPHIPLLIWWAVESKAATDRAAVLGLLARAEDWNQPLVRPVLVERLARRYASAGSAEDLVSCATLLERAPSSADAELLVRGMEKGFEGRKLEQMPPVLDKPLAKLWSNGSPSLALVRLEVRLGSHEALEQAIAWANDKKRASKERAEMIALWSQFAPVSDVPRLIALSESGKSDGVRKAALAALGRFNDPEIAQHLLKAYPTLPTDLQGVALGLLASRKAWALELIAAVDRKQIADKDVTPDYLRQMALLADKQLDEAVEKRWGKVAQATPDEKRARIHGIQVSLKLAPGDVERGHAVFMKTCGVCHTLFNEGNKIGPELTGADRKNVKFMLENIVDPSAVIRKEYFQYTAALTDGRVLAGLIADSTPDSVTLLDAKNQRTLIPRSEIESLERSPLSLMPERILDALDVQEVRDLIAYLKK